MDPIEDQRPLRLDALTVGSMQAGCYIVCDKATDELMIVDPGGSPDIIVESVRMTAGDPRYIVNTHGHADHIEANGRLKELYPEADLCIHEKDAPMLEAPKKNLSLFFGGRITSPPADRLLKEGDELRLGEQSFTVIHLPGHTPGGIALYWPGTGNVAGMVFSGDALFAGGIGRSDLPGGDHDTLVQNIREKLLTLPDDTVVLPGHGLHTTIREERETNPFFSDN